ncbi:MAG: UDP-N-acetylmuramate dehydrogenase [Lachnospiraceae bacterium]|nr:UDP-N-acetylmuramate dehydrogenase [Lachnospiraceae bacterium]
MNWKETLQHEYADKLRLEWNVPLAKYTTFHIGGLAECLISARSSKEVQLVLQFCHKYQVELHILGNGSNLLVDDRGIRGIVLYIGRRMQEITVNGTQIVADAGARMALVARAAAEAGLTGLEFSFGIPGTIGGGVIMNAGAYGGELSQVVTKVEAFDAEGNFHVLEGDALCFGYRKSTLKTHGYIVTKVYLECKPGDKEAIQQLMADLGAQRRGKQPLEYPSAGSTFKRPEGYFAGQLIDQAGLKGYTVGGAQVSEKHAGFIINKGGATSRDVRTLIGYIKTAVSEKFGVELEPEYVIWDYDSRA